MANVAPEPVVRSGLFAGGSRIRTFSSARSSAGRPTLLSEPSPRYSIAARFASDSALEGTGLEPSVPLRRPSAP